MRTIAPPQTTAWAPWLDGAPDWLLDRDRRAGGWLVSQGQLLGARIVVQGTANARGYTEEAGALGQLARRGAVATYRSPVGPGATFAPQPDVRLLATAMRTAAGRCLVATEIPTFPLEGWAMETGALNLATMQPTPDSRTQEQRDMLQSFVSLLYNGWSHPEVGRRASAHYLPKLAASGMTYAVFVGSIVALDPAHLDSAQGVKAMRMSLPPAWAAQAAELDQFWG